jgi:ABC-type transporter Mla subunit MlaD
MRRPALGHGLSLSDVENMRKIFDDSQLLASIWTDIERKLIRRQDLSGDEFWLSVPASEVLNSSSVTESKLNRDWYEAIPGLLSGTGLLVTFIAILIALLHVKLEGNQVKGLPLLIEGLSGKFVSSIAALFAATIFVIFEKQQFHTLDRSVSKLAAAVADVVPILTPTHLLVELQKDMGEQSVAFRSFNADLSGRLKQSFSESMGPTLERMVTTIEDMNQLLRAAESAKSDTISESLGGMITRLEESLTQSLGKMGEQFASSLSGNTMTQFSKLSESLAGAASVLEQMNAHNQTTQTALTELVSFAKESAAEQMALGRTQVEDLTNVLRSMLVQIEQATGSSVTNMGAALTALMSDLSSKVVELTDQTRSSMMQTTQASTDAAKSVLKDASDWSATSKEQLAALIEKHTAQLNTVDRLRESLDKSATTFNGAALQFNSILTRLQQVSADAATSTTAMSGAAKSVRDSQEGLQRVAGLSSTQVEKLSLAGKEQQELLERIAQAMTQYQQTFVKVESSASALLQTLEKNLANHLELTQRGYDSLIKVSDEHFSNATQRLGASVEELSEYLTDLSEVMASRPNGTVRNGN